MQIIYDENQLKTANILALLVLKMSIS